MIAFQILVGLTNYLKRVVIKMRVFIFGGSGMLGRYVYKYLKDIYADVIQVNRKDLDITKVTKRKLFNSNIGKGDWVINCAGVISQRKGVPMIDYVTVNSLFPHLLQHVCESRGAKLIHISTDCVYKGDIGKYDESFIHDAVDVYGRTKSLGEPEKATVIRTSIIGEEVSNKLSFIEWVKSNKGGEINGFVDHAWNGITCFEFANICRRIIEGELSWVGVKHIFSEKVVSKYDMACMINDTYDLGIKVNAVLSGKWCDRSITSCRDDVTVEVPSLHEQVLQQKNFNIL